MYLRPEAIRALEERYGRPAVLRLRQDIGEQELGPLLASQKYGRAHDFTFFIFDPAGRVALIRKPVHPPGVYRAPSGGVHPGEDIEAGILREAREETGLTVRLARYLLRVEALFTCGEAGVPWTSHVFTASGRGPLRPLDTGEICAARWATLAELQGPVRAALLASGKGLLRYRVDLTDAVVRLLQREV